MWNSCGKRIKFGKAGLDYIYKESSHDGMHQRNEYISTVNCLDGVDVYKQFQYYWDRADERHETQLRHYVISFSDREIDPNDPAAVELAHEWSSELADKLWGPDAERPRQVIIATQIDNGDTVVDEDGNTVIKGAHCHSHILVNDCDMTNCYGFSVDERSINYFGNQAKPFFKEKFAEAGIEFDYGRNKDVQHYSQYERVHSGKFEERRVMMEEKRAMIDKRMDGESIDEERLQEINNWLRSKENKYVWKEHLLYECSKAKAESANYDEFIQKLGERGIDYDDSGKHNTFTIREDEYAKYTSADYPAHQAKKRGYKLGAEKEFDTESLKAYFETNPEPTIAPAPVKETSDEILDRWHKEAAEQMAQAHDKIKDYIEDIAGMSDEERRDFVDRINRGETPIVKKAEPKEEAISEWEEEIEEEVVAQLKPKRRTAKAPVTVEESYDEEDETESEDDQLLALGYGNITEENKLEENEEDALAKLRAVVIQRTQTKGEAIMDAEIQAEPEDEDDSTLNRVNKLY